MFLFSTKNRWEEKMNNEPGKICKMCFDAGEKIFYKYMGLKIDCMNNLHFVTGILEKKLNF